MAILFRIQNVLKMKDLPQCDVHIKLAKCSFCFENPGKICYNTCHEKFWKNLETHHSHWQSSEKISTRWSQTQLSSLHTWYSTTTTTDFRVSWRHTKRRLSIAKSFDGMVTEEFPASFTNVKQQDFQILIFRKIGPNTLS